MPLLRNWSQWRQFKSLSWRWRNIVVYSESGQDWHHFQPIIDELTGDRERPVTYVTSDPLDPGLVQDNPRLKAFCIEEGWFRTIFFQVCQADTLVLTMMDLGNLDLKRSLYPVYYIYLFHGMGSTHMVDFENSYDNYDAIFCVGPHQANEIRKRESVAELPAKHLFQHGYHRLEELMSEAHGNNIRYQPGEKPVILVAPTWGEDSIFNRCGNLLVQLLLAGGCRVIMRPHYHTLRLSPGLCESIRVQFEGNPDFEYIDAMGESDSLFRSHLLICDWSAMAIEYALGLEKPVLFIDLPRRIRNENWQQLDIEPIESSIREQVGDVLDPDALELAPARIQALLQNPDVFRERITRLRGQLIYNLGNSVSEAAGEIARLADERAALRSAGSFNHD
jgi:YidC/Oxa1 family membrane protein insertase